MKNFRFNEKSTSSGADKLFNYAKRDYGDRRGFINTSNNKLNSKLRNNLKHVEEEIKTKRVVYCGWINEKLYQLMLSNGLLVYVEIDIYTGDIKKINFDRYFIGKIVSENICDGKFFELFAMNLANTFVYFSCYHATAYSHIVQRKSNHIRSLPKAILKEPSAKDNCRRTKNL